MKILRKPSKYGGHTKTHQRGYIMVYLPTHAHASKDGYVFEHILAYERHYGIIIDRNKFCVHHVNGIKTDNRIENLKLMTLSDHMSYHSKKRHEEHRKNANKIDSINKCIEGLLKSNRERSVAVNINGVVYESVCAASRAIGKSRHFILDNYVKRKEKAI